MAEKQLSHAKLNQMYKQIDITISDDLTLSICPDSISLRQRDLGGKFKTVAIPKDNWFQVLHFSNIIEYCFNIGSPHKHNSNDTLIKTKDSNHSLNNITDNNIVSNTQKVGNDATNERHDTACMEQRVYP